MQLVVIVVGCRRMSEGRVAPAATS